MDDLSPQTINRMHSLVWFIHNTQIYSMKILPECGGDPTSVRLGFHALNKDGFLKSRTRDVAISTYEKCKHFIEADATPFNNNMLRLTEAGREFLKDRSAAQ